MEDRVGDPIPSEAEVKSEAKTIDGVYAKTEGYGCSLTKEERGTRAHIRPGGEKVVADVAHIADKYGIDNPDTPVAGMLADLLLAQRIRPASIAARALADRYEDTIMEAESECWHAATALYSLLVERAKHNPQLAGEIASLRAFFATGKRKKAAAK